MKRTCNKCSEVKPANPVYFFRRRTREDGLDPWCKNCRMIVMARFNRDGRLTEIGREYRAKNRDRLRRKSRDWWAVKGRERNASVIRAKQTKRAILRDLNR